MNVIPVIVLLLVLQNPDPAKKVNSSLEQRDLNKETYYSLFNALMKRRGPGLTPEQLERRESMNKELDRIAKEGQSLTDAGDYDQAIALYEQAFQYDPRFVFPYVRMGDIRYVQGKPEEALQFYRIAESHMEKVPFNISVDTTPEERMGDLYTHQGKYKDAVAAYRQIIYRVKEFDWSLPDGKSIKTELFGNSKKIRSGVSSYAPDVLARYALALSRTGQQAEANRVYSWAIKQVANMDKDDSRSFNPRVPCLRDSFPIAWAGLVNELPTDKSTFEASCYVLVSLTIGGESDWIDEDRKLWHGDKGAALIAAQRAVKANPDYAPAQLVLGLAYAQQPEEDKQARVKAEAAYRKVLANGSEPAILAANEALRHLKAKEKEPISTP